MKKLGFSVEVDEVGNVIARAGRGHPKILFCGHMDTVEGVIPVERRRNVLFGRGAVDAKGPLAAMIVAAARHLAERRGGSITLAAVVDEEGRSRGMKHFLAHCGETFDYAVFGEPGRAYGVSIAYRGRALLKLAIRTEEGHSATPYLFKNAIEHAYKALEKIKEVVETKAEDYFHSTSVCPTLIKGGKADNVVPGECQVIIDVRIPPNMEPHQILEKAKRVAESYSAEEGVEVQVELLDSIKGFEVSEKAPLVEAFKKAIRKITGKEPILRRKTASCDANLFVAERKTPTVVYGPGNSKLDHAPNENISIPEYLQAIKVLEEVLQELTSTRES